MLPVWGVATAMLALTRGSALLAKETGGVSVRGGVGSTARAVSAAGTLAILGFGYNMGHTGGELVFRDGAASAYTANGAGTPGGR